jgi:RND family efflux transporter MFP subunit
MKIGFKIAAALIVPLMLASCGGKKKELAIEEKPVPVTVAPASISNITVFKIYTGTLEGWRQAKIYASIPEAVVEIPADEGDEVSAGQAIIILDRQGRASQFRQAEAVYQDAKDNFEKMSRLFEQGAISEQMYNNLKTNLDVARANYEAARQQVELTSPISGVLTDVAVNIGQSAPLGAALATVAQVDKMRLTIFVDTRSTSYLRVGQEAQITVEALDNARVEGEITDIARSADPETRLIRVELQIGNSRRRLKPGMFARAEIVVAELNKVLVVPREAVFSAEGIMKVYVVEGDRAKERSIEIGESNLELVQVISGLSENDRVIVLGRNQVSDGSLVKIVEDTQSANFTDKSRES